MLRLSRLARLGDVHWVEEGSFCLPPNDMEDSSVDVNRRLTILLTPGYPKMSDRPEKDVIWIFTSFVGNSILI